MTETSPTGVLRSATAHPVARVAARAGYVIGGVLHLLIAYLIFRIALGSGGNADQTGALGTIADTTAGNVALWAVAVALVPLTLWRLAETILRVAPRRAPPPRPERFPVGQPA